MRVTAARLRQRRCDPRFVAMSPHRAYLPVRLVALQASRPIVASPAMTSMTINGEAVRFTLDPATPLLWALRDAANLTGAKYGCDSGDCGACTVIVDERAVASCTLPIASLEGAEVITIEGLAPNRGHPDPAGVGGRAGQPVRLLRARCHPGNRGPAESQSAAERGRDRGADQHLPLRHRAARAKGDRPGLDGDDRRRQPERIGRRKALRHLQRPRSRNGSATAHLARSTFRRSEHQVQWSQRCENSLFSFYSQAVPCRPWPSAATTASDSRVAKPGPSVPNGERPQRAERAERAERRGIERVERMDGDSQRQVQIERQVAGRNGQSERMQRYQQRMAATGAAAG